MTAITTNREQIERVREQTDLVALIGEHVALKPRGREFVGLCPFHDDHTPSMTVVTHKGDPFYKCHSRRSGVAIGRCSCLRNPESEFEWTSGVPMPSP